MAIQTKALYASHVHSILYICILNSSGFAYPQEEECDFSFPILLE